MGDTEWLDDRESRAWRGLQFMNMQVDGELARRLASSSALSLQDYVVLVGLTDDPSGRIRLNRLGDSLAWEKSRLSHQITRMEKRGLVSKEKCAEDKRGSYVVITPKGRTEIEAAAPGHLEAVRELFIDRLTNQQLDTLAEIAETVIAAMGQQSECPDG